MARRPRATVFKQGRRYRLGKTEQYGGIWRKRPWGWRLVSQYPLTEDGWRVANQQFAIWEPDAQAVPPPNRPKRSQRRHALFRGWVGKAAAAGVLVVIGGGIYLGVGSSSLPSERGPSAAVGIGYLAKAADFVIFIQWNNTNGSLSGSAEVVGTSGQAPNLATDSQTYSVSGTLRGSTITLSFDGGAKTFGTLSGGAFTVNFPQSDGSLEPVTFESASAAQYNSALDSFKGRIKSANQTATNAEALQQEKQKIYDDAAKVDADIGTDSDPATGLAQAEAALSTDVQQTPVDLQEGAKDLAQTKGDEQITVSEAQQYPGGNYGEVCQDAASVNQDAASVNQDAGSVNQDAGSVENDLSSVRSTIQQLQSDFAALQSDESALPGYSPANAPNQSTVSKAITQAKAAIASGLATTNSYIDQVNAYVTTAFQYAAQAENAGDCGTPSGPPPALPHIT